jgi:hypothetical protein
MSRLLQILAISATCLSFATSKGTKITSKNCEATIYFDHIKLTNTADKANPQLITLKATTEDPCTATDLIVGNEATRTFSFQTDNDTELKFVVSSSQGRFEMTKIFLGEKEFRARQSWSVANSYTLAPSGAFDTTFVCDYTTFSYVTTSKPNEVQSLTFTDVGKDGKPLGRPFLMRIGDEDLEANLNQCVGILNEGTILGGITLLMLLSIVSFALFMMTTISPMDKFESPKDKQLYVPIEKTN